MAFRILLFLFISLCCYQKGNAQDFIRGKDFYFAFPSPLYATSEDLFISAHIEQINSGPLNILIENGEGIISFDSYPTFAFPRIISFPLEYCNDFESEEINNYGIHIIFSSEVVMRISEIDIGLSDATNVLPKKSLGTEYIITNVKAIEESFGSEGGDSQITIVATEDDTELSFIPTFTTKNGSPPNIPVDISLNKNQMYEICPLIKSTDISGTIIKSCKPIAVFSGANNVYNPYDSQTCCSDRTWSQLTSTQYWGKNFYTVPFFSFEDNVKSDYTLKITAMEDNTEIQFDGEVVKVLDARETYTKNIVIANKVVNSNKPIQVAQIMHNGYLLGNTTTGRLGDPSMFFVPPIDAQSTSAFLEDLDTDTNVYAPGRTMVTVILKTEDLVSLNTDSDFELNSFKPFSYDPNYMYGNYALPYDQEYIEIENPFGFQAYSYRLADDFSHIYNGEYSLESYFNGPEISLPNSICINESFEAKIVNIAASELYDFEWNFGNGDTSDKYSTTYTYSEAGTYDVSLQLSFRDCEYYELTQSINIIGESNTNFAIEGNTTVGKNDNENYFIPDALDSSTIEWEIEGGLRITTLDKGVEINWLRESGTIYATEITAEGCTGAKDTLNIVIIDNEVQEGNCFGFYLLQPNPVSEILQFIAGVDKDKKYTFRIFNSIGQLTDEQTKELTRGSTNISFDVNDYPSGVYFLNVDNGECRETIKWVKMR